MIPKISNSNDSSNSPSKAVCTDTTHEVLRSITAVVLQSPVFFVSAFRCCCYSPPSHFASHVGIFFLATGCSGAQHSTNGNPPSCFHVAQQPWHTSVAHHSDRVMLQGIEKMPSVLRSAFSLIKCSMSIQDDNADCSK